MNNPPLPTSLDDIDPCQWQTFAPYFEALQQQQLTAENRLAWLEAWSNLDKVIMEAFASIYIDKSIDTADSAKEAAFLNMLDQVLPQTQVAEQTLKERLLSLVNGDNTVLGDDMSLVIRKMQNAADLFREDNIPLLTELAKLDNEYDKITGALKADWDGEEKNLSQLTVFLQDKNRSVRERAWKTSMALWLGCRQQLNAIYTNMVTLRQQVADNAGLPDYRAYAFRDKGRFDYTPEDCFTFHEAIEAVVVPAAQRIYVRKQQQLGLNTLRPWDVQVDPSQAPTLKPYAQVEELIQGGLNIFQQVDPVLARHMGTMAEENLLDLDTRPGKALGGFCAELPLRQRPFIFMNGVGLHDDVQTLLHEAGHAFHVFETADLPYIWQKEPPMEFCEVASMSMELLAAPYITQTHGGFYTEAEAARARIEHLEGIITFLPYMAVVDLFQHWVYTHVNEALKPDNCDAAWDRLWQRFMPGINYEDYEAERMTGWHRKPHIFGSPFYYIEYGMAQIGALQIWRNSLSDQAAAIAAYRRALALGGTKPLPELFAAAGAEFRFDKAMLSGLVALVEKTIADLETEQ
ncbi:MAG: M3 family oligoendopeptidase [Ardenticatenaceae bacterium]|nr:M3 family oligoendopeptidase [Ardenticatenaceae bacterium]